MAQKVLVRTAGFNSTKTNITPLRDGQEDRHVQYLREEMLLDCGRKIQQVKWFKKLADSRLPDFIVGGETPYMLRWWVIPRNRIFNIYLHRFLRSDDDRALHDHPWVNMSYLLEGEYTEWTIAKGGVHHSRVAKQGSFKFRNPRFAHRVELHAGPCWSLFITGPVVRKWGFHCTAGWRSWKIFTSERDKGAIGRGCE